MRLYTAEEFEDELFRRGCTKTEETHDFGHIWQGPDGRYFLVPHPEEPHGRYPDWMLDDLIRRVRLPSTPKPN
jgi:hypothetical protein